MLCAMCALSAYTFSTIARVSAAVGADTYRDAWSRVFGKRSAAFPNAAIIFKTFVGSPASMASLAGAKGLLAAPNAWIGILSATVLLPLWLLRTRRRPCGPHRAGAAPRVHRGGWPARRPQPRGARPRLHAGNHLPRALQRAEVLRRARRPKARLEAPLVQRRRRGRLCAGGGPVRLHHDRRLPHLRFGLVRLHPEQLRHRRRARRRRAPRHLLLRHLLLPAPLLRPA